MRNSSFQAFRRLLSASRALQSHSERQTIRIIPSRNLLPLSQRASFGKASITSAPATRVTPPEIRRPSEQPTEPYIDPQAAIPPASVIDPDLHSTTTSSPTLTPGSTLPTFTTNGNGDGNTIDWSSSFHGLSTTPFTPETSAILMKPLDLDDVEIKPDGIVYLPEIKYRRILNAAFGPGGWGLAPRSDMVVGQKVVTREYALIVHGRFIAQARGECQFFSPETIPTAGEGCKSNALLRCCKDLGVASELWDPRFIREFKRDRCREVWVEHVGTKKRRQIWLRKDSNPEYPYTAVRKVAPTSP